MVEGEICRGVAQGDVEGRELLVDAGAVSQIHGGAEEGAPAELGIGPAGGSRDEGAAARGKRREIDGEDSQVAVTVRVLWGRLLHAEAHEALLTRID
jgi:hypothetical protein